MRPIRAELKQYLNDSYQSKLQSNNFLLHFIFTLLNLPFMLLFIRKSKVDILHAHDAFAYGPIALLNHLLTKQKYIVSPWGSDVLILAKKNKLLNYFIYKSLCNAEEVITDSQALVVDKLVNQGIYKHKIHSIPFGVDVNYFKRDKRERKDFRTDRRELKLNRTAKYVTIISTRNHEPVYDIKTLLIAIPHIIERFNSKEIYVNFIICGTGTLTNELKQIAYSEYNVLKGHDKHIRFTGRLSQQELLEHLCGADIYVSTSLSDAGLSASTAEAMSCSLPIIITNFGDNKNWVQNHNYLFEPKNNVSLAYKLCALIVDQNLRQSNGVWNAELIRDKNNYHKEMEKVNIIYNKLNQKSNKEERNNESDIKELD
jgi:glycosyltransferase involved in cell wall biosynthesis